MFRAALRVLALTALPFVAAPGTGGRAGLMAQAVPPNPEGVPDSVLPEAREDTLPGLLLTHTVSGGGRLVVYRQPESALVAIRFSFPLLAEYGPVRAYARMAQRLARDDLARRAGGYGARVELQCSYDRASFAIVGPARDAAELARILRGGLTWGGWSDRDVRAARFAETARAQQRAETPEPLLEDRLMTRVFPALPAAADSAPRRVTAAMLRAFWDATFQPNRLQAVVVGRVTDSDALAMMSGWPPATLTRAEAAAPDTEETAAESERPPRPEAEAQDVDKAPPPAARPGARPGAARSPRGARPGAPSPPVAAGAAPVPQEPPSSVGQPQVLYSWAAVAWPTRADAAAAIVAARLVSARLSPEQLRLARAELWWSARGRALVALGSATAPDSSAVLPPNAAGIRPAARATPAPGPAHWLTAAVGETRENLSREEVQATALAISREILLSTRTPDGLARFLGEIFERTDRPTGGQAFLRQLGRVDVRAVERALDVDVQPVLVELRK